MQTAKEALLSAGRIQAVTRGRISLDNHAWLMEQVAKGTKFSDYPKSTQVSTGNPITKSSAPKVQAAKPKADKVDIGIQEYVILYSEHDYKAIDAKGKERSMREVCNNCRVSLVQNHCDNPIIVGDTPVKIVRR